MTVLHTLWLPIVASAILVFLASWILHVLLPWHKHDRKKVPDQDRVMDALRPFNLAAGDYMLPGCDSMAEMKSPEFQEKMKRGPVLTATVRGGPPNMGRSLFVWFVYCLVVTYIAAYVGAHALALVRPFPLHGHARRLIGLAAFAGYGLSQWQDTIWFGRSLGTSVRNTIDAIIYALITAAIFGWLAP